MVSAESSIAERETLAPRIDTTRKDSTVLGVLDFDSVQTAVEPPDRDLVSQCAKSIGVSDDIRTLLQLEFAAA